MFVPLPDNIHKRHSQLHWRQRCLTVIRRIRFRSTLVVLKLTVAHHPDTCRRLNIPMIVQHSSITVRQTDCQRIAFVMHIFNQHIKIVRESGDT